MEATDYRDHLCYKNDIFRQHATIGGFYSAANLFNKTHLYILYSQLHEEMKIAQDLLNDETLDAARRLEGISSLSAMNRIMHAEISDNFLTGGCIELIGKTILLSKGILIHKIISKGTPGSLKKLAQQQTLRPVLLTEYFDSGGAFVVDDKNRRRLNYVSDETLNYTTVYKDSYVANMPLSNNFIVAARQYRVLRNTTHFPPALGAEAIEDLYKSGDRTLYGIYDIIRDEWETLVEPLMNDIRKNAQHKINYPFENVISWVRAVR